MSTPLKDFVTEVLKANPTTPLVVKDFMDIYFMYEKQEKKMVVDTWEDAIKHYRQSITTDIMYMSGEDYYDSLFG